MSRPEGWSASPELTTPVDLGGLRFADRETERDYRSWRTEHVRAFTHFAMYAGAGAAVLAWFAVLFGALVDLRGLALVAIPLIAAVLAGAAVLTREDERLPLLMPAGALVNLFGGLVAVGMTLPIHSTPVVGACAAMSAYFGLTMFRLPPLLATAAVAPYLVFAAGTAVVWHAGGTIGTQDLVLGLFIPLTTLATGMLVNVAMEWITRQTYLDHLIIESQQDALFEERTSLARFLSPGIAETVHRTGFPGEVGCEIYSLTAVSIDLRGFTKYTQRHGAERMVEVLQDYYAAVIASAEEFGATVKDFAGDGALVLVGAPYPRADHTRAGLRLARDMLVRVREVTARWSTPDTPLGAGVGIASGECAVGAIGSLSQLEYAAVGTAVNLSHRLCDIAKDGQILMAAGTARALEESPGWRREIVTLSGVPESVEVTVEDTLAPDEMIPTDRPASLPGAHSGTHSGPAPIPAPIPAQPGPEREASVPLPE
jgi:class 3 adenylate cyclase